MGYKTGCLQGNYSFPRNLGLSEWTPEHYHGSLSQRGRRKNAKLIASEVISFSDLPKTLWIQLETIEDYNEEKLLSLLSGNEGKDNIIIYIRSTKQMKRMPARWNVQVTEELKVRLMEAFGEENIRVVQEKL